MNTWVTGDTHFGHELLVKLSGRPENFSALELKRLRKKVGLDDLLIHLGDFCIGDEHFWHKEWASIPGRNKILVLGNHDKRSLTWYLNKGWSAVVNTLSLTIFGESIIFSHRPINPAVTEATINIHGHHHGNTHHDRPDWYAKGFHLEYAPELFSYAPLLLNQKTLYKTLRGCGREQNV